jgi:dihydrofolate synthase/folylpolyglutamate synthase
MEYIHLAGTNGKGSTAQYIAEIVWRSHSGGLFTSPHIFSPRERFVIDGEAISEGAYEKYTKAAQRYGEESSSLWTMFGVWTRAALQWFSDSGVEYAVIETGMGGARDQTNVIDAGMQVITPVSLDHTQYLGDTVRKIAREKCGVIRWGSTVISHPQRPDAADVISRACDRMDARLIVLDEGAIRVQHADTDGQVFSFRYEGLLLEGQRIRSLAAVQVQNACVAAMAAYELGIPAEDIAAGIARTRLAARGQYEDGVLVDAAHNIAALDELRRTVERYFSKKHVTVLTAVMEDKDVRAMAGGIASFADFIICTRADRKRGLPAGEYVKFFDNAFAMEDPAYAFEYAKEVAGQKKGIVVVCGSFYLVRYALGSLEA